MTTLDDLPFAIGEPSAPTNAGVRPRPHRHDWVRHVQQFETGVDIGTICIRCGVIRDELAARRGKNNRKRGGSLQLWFNSRLGLVNLPGSSGRETDGRSEEDQLAGNAMFVAQVKSGLRFPSWMAKILDGLPRSGGRVPILGIVATPGAGHRRRGVVVMDLEDFVALHGGSDD